MITRKIIFLDRDGVINKKALKGDYVKSLNEFIFKNKLDNALRKKKHNKIKH